MVTQSNQKLRLRQGLGASRTGHTECGQDSMVVLLGRGLVSTVLFFAPPLSGVLACQMYEPESGLPLSSHVLPAMLPCSGSPVVCRCWCATMAAFCETCETVATRQAFSGPPTLYNAFPTTSVAVAASCAYCPPLCLGLAALTLT